VSREPISPPTTEKETRSESAEPAKAKARTMLDIINQMTEDNMNVDVPDSGGASSSSGPAGNVVEGIGASKAKAESPIVDANISKAKAETPPKAAIPQTPPKANVPETQPKVASRPRNVHCALSCSYQGCVRVCENKLVKHTGACLCLDHEADRIECCRRAYSEGTPYFCTRYCQNATADSSSGSSWGDGSQPKCGKECTMYEGHVGDCMCEAHGGYHLQVKLCRGPPKVEAIEAVKQQRHGLQHEPPHVFQKVRGWDEAVEEPHSSFLRSIIPECSITHQVTRDSAPSLFGGILEHGSV
jgi:hypothetical protein